MNTTTAFETKILRTVAKKSFCTIGTASPAGHGHSAGVIYEAVDGALWSHTLRSSRKARNIASDGRIGVCIPFRRMPMGPPFTIQFQADAHVVAMDSPEITELLQRGALTSITGHGELEMEDGCFVRMEPKGTMHSFGPGARTIDLIRDPLNSGARSFRHDGRSFR
jgi:hypothetical protein